MLKIILIEILLGMALAGARDALAADAPARPAGTTAVATNNMVGTASLSLPVGGADRTNRGNRDKKPGDVLECLLEPHLIVNVGSPVEGTLSQVLVDRGDSVARGQVVARLNAQVETATVNLRAAQEAFGQRKMQRSDDLFRQQLISASERDELETQTRLAALELKQQQEVLALRTLTSPINGVVVERMLAPGDHVAQEKVLKLAQIDPLNVEVVVPVEMLGQIRVGMVGDVNLAPWMSGSYKARVVVVDRVVDAASGTFGVRLELPNRANKIPAGIRCGVRFTPHGASASAPS